MWSALSKESKHALRRHHLHSCISYKHHLYGCISRYQRHVNNFICTQIKRQKGEKSLRLQSLLWITYIANLMCYMHALFCRPTQYTQQPVEFPVEGRRGSARVCGSSNHLNGGELSVAVCRRHSSIRASERHGWVITSCRQGACVRRRRQDRSSDRAAAGWSTKSMTKYKFSSKAKKYPKRKLGALSLRFLNHVVKYMFGNPQSIQIP